MTPFSSTSFPSVLFVCVHNAGRSQMAKALFNAVARERGLSVRAGSAGTKPARRVHRNVVEAMIDIGVDLSHESPRLLTNEMVDAATRVVTMGCGVDSRACPAVLYKNVIDWGLPDPRDRSPQEVRAIRDQIRSKVEELIAAF